MNAAQLEAAFTNNKPVALGVAAAGVVGLGLLRRKKTAAAKASAAPATVGTTTAGGVALPYSANGQTYGLTGAGGAYDSTATDIVGAMNPQLESLQTQLTTLTNAIGQQQQTPVPVPAPVTAPPQAPAPVAAPTPQTIPVPQAAPNYGGPQYVTAVRGDTLSGIAARYPSPNITAQTIAALNGISNINKIYAGQTYRIY